MIEHEQAPEREIINKFGSDGIRGEVGREITPELGYNVGRAIAAEVDGNTLLVCHDGRDSGPALSSAVMHGIQNFGKIAYNSDKLPTPAADYLAKKYGYAAVVVTASHNPAKDNGFKLLLPGGGKPGDELISRIEARLNSNERYGGLYSGRIVNGLNKKLKPEYQDFLIDSVPEQLLRGQVIALDTASGAYYDIAKPVLHALGAEVVQIDPEPNGKNINRINGATKPAQVKWKILEGVINYNYGVLTDGDGDRILMIDQYGQELNGDHILYILAKHLKQYGELSNNVVVGTEYSGKGLEEALDKIGIELKRAKNGDRHVAQGMADNGAVLGSERSGHVIYGPKAKTGDGLLVALKTLEAVRIDYGGDLAKAHIDMVDYPRKEINVKLEAGVNGKEIVERARADISEIEAAIKKMGWLIVRASGTEPLVRIMVEATHENIAAGAAKQIETAVKDAA